MTPRISTPRTEFGSLFVGVARLWARVVSEELTRSGLTDSNWPVLLRLDELGKPVSQSELSHYLATEGAQLTRQLDQLEAGRLIERRLHPSDRRARRLHLTTAGKREVKKIRARLDTLEDEFIRGFGDAEIDTLNLSFKRLRGILQGTGL